MAALLIALLALGRGITAWSAVPAAAMIGVLVLIGGQATGQDLWSPYYRISTYDDEGRALSARSGSLDQPVHLYVNGIGLQSLGTVTDPGGFVLHRQLYHWLPDRKFDRVLIIGAGTGNDVALALSMGVQHVDAVEIDPVIARIGPGFHPDRPYDDPRVSVHGLEARRTPETELVARGP